MDFRRSLRGHQHHKPSDVGDRPCVSKPAAPSDPRSVIIVIDTLGRATFGAHSSGTVTFVSVQERRELFCHVHGPELPNRSSCCRRAKKQKKPIGTGAEKEALITAKSFRPLRR
ncbi:hypothetical protein BaRGS_00007887 [Batillaria attramentaria]|uniref:Uncharacterized protein n=1 Tax=Batillaria attramentaria TaxID=370345 RepID=A0ABD0LNU6_9CAEN